MIRAHFTLPRMHLAQEKIVDQLNIPSLIIRCSEIFFNDFCLIILAGLLLYCIKVVTTSFLLMGSTKVNFLVFNRLVEDTVDANTNNVNKDHPEEDKNDKNNKHAFNYV
jgi:hypothetical protein